MLNTETWRGQGVAFYLSGASLWNTAFTETWQTKRAGQQEEKSG